MINKEDIKKWLEDQPPLWLQFDKFEEVVHKCITELSQDKWVSVEDGKPKQGVRVLLKTNFDEHCPFVVGYWGCGEWEACTVNVEAEEYYSGNAACIERAFDNSDVTHWQPLPELPNDK